MAALQGERAPAEGADTASGLNRKDRFLVIAAALMALFLGALDTLVMEAAMPTIVADMGRLELYSWVFSVYLLSRAVALPIFGKLADLYSGKHLFGFAIAIFLAGSLVAGFSTSMVQLILARVLQGVGAGAAFALVYILLADIAAPGKRGKMMSIASFVWGLASVLGPPMGGFIVNYWSWRWIFFINLPLGIFILSGHLSLFQGNPRKETPCRPRPVRRGHSDPDGPILADGFPDDRQSLPLAVAADNRASISFTGRRSRRSTMPKSTPPIRSCQSIS